METSPSTKTEELFSTGCCPRFDPRPFQDARFEWRDEPFVKVHVLSLLHVPLNISRRIVRAQALIEGASARPSAALMLSEDASPWGTDLYIHVTKQVPGAEMTTLSGSFLSKVFEGPFRNTPKWQNAMTEYVESKGYEVEKIYVAYTTCPACAKAYGKNYVVLFARIRNT
jgi:hypothetical protein